MFERALPAIALLAMTSRAVADSPGQCHVIDASFVPSEQLQIVAWIETTDGAFVDTIYITNKTGRYGIGNRPGRFDLNSGPTSNDMWPYGRRITVFPVWAHRHGLSWPEVDFQNGDDNDISHPASQSSPESTPPFCRPMASTDSGWDAGTCASPGASFSDKGVFSGSATSLYPPRSDLTFTSCGASPSCDSTSVAMYQQMNPFDAISQATPAAGMQSDIVWPIPSTLGPGTYNLFVEVGKEYDFNGTYNAASYPSPSGISFSDYGAAYRGQPSIVYSTPFTIGASEVMSASQSYVGYGDPTGASGTLNPPDSTITTNTPASGAFRLELFPGSMDVLRVDARPVEDNIPPAAVANIATSNITGVSADVTFVAPGNDGNVGTVAGYEVRVRANDMITDANFEDSMAVAVTILPSPAGSTQAFELDGLLPETPYSVGIRAFDECHNESPIAVFSLTTSTRQNGEVDACFVATAAYGSLMANDVETLRSFRDRVLKSTVFGELFVESYYTFGPPVAQVVGESELLRASARGMLEPVVAAARWLNSR